MRKPFAVAALTALTLAVAACGGPGSRPAPVPPEARTDPPTTVNQTIRESNTLQGDVPAAGSGRLERGTTDAPTSNNLTIQRSSRPGAPSAGTGRFERGKTDAPDQPLPSR